MRNVAARRANGFELNLGEVDLTATPTGRFATRHHSSTNGLPRNAIVQTESVYNGQKPKIGKVILLIGKKDNALFHFCMYTVPHNFGKGFIERLSKQNGNHSMKERHPGIEWIGADPANLMTGSKFLYKFGWFANVGTAGSTAKLHEMIKKLAFEIMSSRSPIDFYLADIEMTEAEQRNARQIMNGLVGEINADSDED